VRGRAEVVDALAPWFRERLGTDVVEILDFRRHAEGWSWQTYTMDVQWLEPGTGAQARRGYAVRVEPEDGLLAPYDIDGQYALHRAILEHREIPMPDLYWLEPDPSVLGMPFYVMERLHGIVPVQWRGKDPTVFPSDEARREIGHQFVDILARIHGVDWQAAGLALPGAPLLDPLESAHSWIDHWSDYYEASVLVDLPVMRYAIGWMRVNATCTGVLTLCHGDYRLGNFMVRDGIVNGIFDWELAHVSDPVEDVAYSGLPLFRGRNPLLSQLLARDDYFDRYEERTGVRVDPDVFRFWTVLGLVKAAASHLRGSRAFEEGRVGDLRLAAMGHQVQYVLRHIASELGVDPHGRGAR
jgi:aminoglycoside phosphotransferase (APT) family kinase protein